MFTYKFLGLTEEDAPGAYTYGSLPAKPELGHMLVFEKSRTRYAVTRIEGEGLVGDDGYINEKELAWREINQGKAVPTVWLQKLIPNEMPLSRSFSYEEVKEFSQKNREARLATSVKTKSD
jgi:hypothetical protein